MLVAEEVFIGDSDGPTHEDQARRPTRPAASPRPAEVPPQGPSSAVRVGEAAAAVGPDPYRLRILTRCRVAGFRLAPGSVLYVSRDKLRSAAYLVRNRTAVPADAATQIDVEIFLRLNTAPGSP